MAFDAGMLAASLSEIRKTATGARIEKVTQPEHDEIVLQMRTFDGGKRLLINAGSNNPRIGFTNVPRENPAVPPMFCTLLRKHLSGAKLSAVRQLGFERVAELEFETRDEMGFPCVKYLMAEIMGKYSNLIFLNQDRKIVQALYPVDFTTSRLRQVLPGMTYEAPPAQDKQNPMDASWESFRETMNRFPPDKAADKAICTAYLGIAASVAREMCYRACGSTDEVLGHVQAELLWASFSTVMNTIREEKFEPCIVMDGERPVEYAFLPLTQYSSDLTVRTEESAGTVLDCFFDSRDKLQMVHQRATDLLHILTNAESRLVKKMELQRNELKDCEHGEEYKKQGDLITANIYQLHRGDKSAVLTDYDDWHEDGTYGTVEVRLDERLTPAANAQRLFKKYTKSRNARVELTRQLEIGQAELDYIQSVLDALNHAENASDLGEIREELYRSGYASKMKTYSSRKQGNAAPSVMIFRTTHGYKVLCGKNNTQNEYITHKVAAKNDYWFHIKNRPGSHAVMICNGEEPDSVDFTEAAEIAAFYSSGAGGENIPVDYTLVRHLQKVAGAKPGFVIYHTNWTAYVTPSAEKIQSMRTKE